MRQRNLNVNGGAYGEIRCKFRHSGGTAGIDITAGTEGTDGTAGTDGITGKKDGRWSMAESRQQQR